MLSSLVAVGKYYLTKTLEAMRLFLFEMVEVAAVVIVTVLGPSFAELVPGQEVAEGWIEAKAPLWELQQHRRLISSEWRCSYRLDSTSTTTSLTLSCEQ